MKVRELKAILNQQDEDAIVVFRIGEHTHVHIQGYDESVVDKNHPHGQLALTP